MDLFLRIGALVLISALAACGQAGQMDPTFDPGAANADGAIRALLLLPDGKIMAGGDFTTWNGKAAPGLVRLWPGGARDESYQPGLAENNVRQLAMQGSNLLVLVILPTLDASIVRLKHDGTLDPSFGPVAITFGEAFAFNDQRLFATGQEPNRNRAILNYYSAADGTFEKQAFLSCCPGEHLHAALATDDGGVIVGGKVSLVFPQSIDLAKFNADGRDTNFAASTTETYHLLRGRSNGIFYAQASINSGANYQITRRFSDGSVDTNFNDGALATGPFAFQPDGRIIVSQESLFYLPSNAPSVLRLNFDGSADSNFVSAVVRRAVSALAVQADGRILAGGSDLKLVRLLNDEPVLQFNRPGTNGEIAWPAAYTNFHLQEASSLGAPGWTNSALALATNAGLVTATNTAAGRQMFYRLQR